MRVELTVNSVEHVVDDVWELESLLHLLRERLGLRGTKDACEQGECGSCSVYLDGTLVCACLVAAGQAEGAEIVTVEGLTPETTAPESTELETNASEPELHPVQQAFLDAGGVQCGFCTPGMIMATHALLEADPDPDDLTIREQLSGNLCRCTGYQKILDAVHLAAARMEQDT